MPTRSVTEDLKVVFAAYLGEQAAGARALPEHLQVAGRVMIMPSRMTTDQAETLVSKMSLAPVMRDVASVAAREVTNVLLLHGLRPADYADLPELPTMVAKKLVDTLNGVPEEFSNTLADTIRMLG